MANPYVNKVVVNGVTKIDITDTTATAADVASGKTFYDASGAKRTGTASSNPMVVVRTPDSHGGTIVTITGDEVSLQTKTATPTASTQTIAPDEGYTGLAQVTVNPIPSNYIIPAGTINVTANGTVDVRSYASASINVQASAIQLQSKTVTPTTSTQTVTADSGYDGLSKVTVNAIPSSYIVPAGTLNITTNGTHAVTSYASVSVNVPVPAGYYNTSAVTATASTMLSGVKAVTSTGTTVTGTLVIQHYYTGSTAPSSSLGNDGDIYLQS